MNTIKHTTYILFIPILILLVTSCNSIEIGENERGILFKRFAGGIDTSIVYLPGVYKIPNYNNIFIYNIEEQSDEIEMLLPMKDAEDLQLIVEYGFRPNLEKLPLLHDKIGRDYAQRLVRPQMELVIDSFLSNLRDDHLDTLNQSAVEMQLIVKGYKALAESYIDLMSIGIKPASEN